MAIEIERKFLLLNDDWRKEASAPVHYRQGYLIGIDRGINTGIDTGTAKSSVRVRIQGDKAFLNIKGATLGIVREEYEYPIPLDDAQKLLDDLCDKPLVEKNRYFIKRGQHTWEIDEFMGDNQGLLVAEVELGSENEAIEKPTWLGEEVSAEPRYYNVCLVAHPYKDW